MMILKEPDLLNDSSAKSGSVKFQLWIDGTSYRIVCYKYVNRISCASNTFWHSVIGPMGIYVSLFLDETVCPSQRLKLNIFPFFFFYFLFDIVGLSFCSDVTTSCWHIYWVVDTIYLLCLNLSLIVSKSRNECIKNVNFMRFPTNGIPFTEKSLLSQSWKVSHFQWKINEWFSKSFANVTANCKHLTISVEMSNYWRRLNIYEINHQIIQDITDENNIILSSLQWDEESIV